MASPPPSSEAKPQNPRKEFTVGSKYRVGRRIGTGSHGVIHLATDMVTGEEVAVKLESLRSHNRQLDHEVKVYQSIGGGVGVPSLRWFGVESKYNCMVMDLLGPSLEELFNFCERKFSLKTVLLLADKLISGIEYIHSKNFIHRGIKPENLVMGARARMHDAFFIDFGWAKSYRDPETNNIIPRLENRKMTSAPFFASIWNHLGATQSRRDDLESLGYVLIYFFRGSLPWDGYRGPSRPKDQSIREWIMEKKMVTSAKDLCKDMPNEFHDYIEYVRKLCYEDEPDYSFLRKLFRDLFVREGYKDDNGFDWMARRPPKIDSTLPTDVLAVVKPDAP